MFRNDWTIKRCYMFECLKNKGHFIVSVCKLLFYNWKIILSTLRALMLYRYFSIRWKATYCLDTGVSLHELHTRYATTTPSACCTLSTGINHHWWSSTANPMKNIIGFFQNMIEYMIISFIFILSNHKWLSKK